MPKTQELKSRLLHTYENTERGLRKGSYTFHQANLVVGPQMSGKSQLLARAFAELEVTHPPKEPSINLQHVLTRSHDYLPLLKRRLVEYSMEESTPEATHIPREALKEIARMEPARMERLDRLMSRLLKVDAPPASLPLTVTEEVRRARSECQEAWREAQETLKKRGSALEEEKKIQLSEDAYFEKRAEYEALKARIHRAEHYEPNLERARETKRKIHTFLEELLEKIRFEVARRDALEERSPERREQDGLVYDLKMEADRHQKSLERMKGTIQELYRSAGDEPKALRRQGEELKGRIEHYEGILKGEEDLQALAKTESELRGDLDFLDDALDVAIKTEREYVSSACADTVKCANALLSRAFAQELLLEPSGEVTLGGKRGQDLSSSLRAFIRAALALGLAHALKSKVSIIDLPELTQEMRASLLRFALDELRQDHILCVTASEKLRKGAEDFHLIELEAPPSWRLSKVSLARKPTKRQALG